jgi:predicted CoA-substrate-specific enzyme activase
MLVAGIDIGSSTSKCVLYSAAHKVVVSACVISTLPSHQQSFEEVLAGACRMGGVEKDRIRRMVGTGYGRNNIPGVDDTKSEIACHAKGGISIFPGTRTIIDIGGQDSKVISIDENGRLADFVMNEKCAAGTGRFLENMARVLQIDLSELSQLSLASTKSATISIMCAVFAESEVISKIATGSKKEDIAKGIHKSVIQRVLSMGEKVGLVNEITFTGGVAKNKGILEALKENLNVNINVAPNPQIIGALGAAHFAAEFL